MAYNVSFNSIAQFSNYHVWNIDTQTNAAKSSAPVPRLWMVAITTIMTRNGYDKFH